MHSSCGTVCLAQFTISGALEINCLEGSSHCKILISNSPLYFQGLWLCFRGSSFKSYEIRNKHIPDKLSLLGRSGLDDTLFLTVFLKEEVEDKEPSEIFVPSKSGPEEKSLGM